MGKTNFAGISLVDVGQPGLIVEPSPFPQLFERALSSAPSARGPPSCTPLATRTVSPNAAPRSRLRWSHVDEGSVSCVIVGFSPYS